MQFVKLPVVATFAIVLSTFGLATPANACPPQVPGLAVQLERATALLYEDLELAVGRHPHGRRLLAGAENLHSAAEHLRVSASRGADLDHLRLDLSDVQQAFQSVQYRISCLGDSRRISRSLDRVQRLIVAVQDQLNPVWGRPVPEDTFPTRPGRPGFPGRPTGPAFPGTGVSVPWRPVTDYPVLRSPSVPTFVPQQSVGIRLGNVKLLITK